MAEPKDKEPSTNSEVKRSKEFQKEVDIKENVMELAKELLESTTEKEFSKLGYEEVEKTAGVYGTGESYGSGTEQNKFSVRVAGKTKSSLEKQVMLGTKRVQSDINFQYNGKMVNIEYKTTEAGFFRGVDSNAISYSFTKTITLDGSKKSELEKGMKELFALGAKKEVGYLTNTKLGVDDKTDKSTTSTVNENKKSMKKLTLKSIFSNEDIFDSINESKEENIQQVKDANTLPLSNVEPYKDGAKKAPKDKFLFLDDKYLQEKFEESGLSHDKYLRFIKDEMKSMYGTENLSDLTPAEKSEFFNHIDDSYSSGEEKSGIKNEVTTAGPSGAGAGAYLTPFAFKATSYAKQKNSKRPKVTKEYKVVPNSEGYNSDGFWQKVNVDALKDTHPLGMPGVKPGSKEEWDATTKGDKNKLKRLGLKESENKQTESPKANLDLTKKKIFSEAENIAKGINKRYLVTEKTSEEYLKERWKKLSNFKLNESIKENSEINDILNECGCQDKPLIKSVDPLFLDKQEPELEITAEKTTSKSKENLEETVTVVKPGSLFGTQYVFYKKDFLDESKKYILDLASRVFVPNPNIK